MIEPLLSDDEFLADVEAAPDHPSMLHLWWLGQSGFLVKYDHERMLIDPYLSDSLTEKYANSGKPHVRMTSRVVDPGRLRDIDSVLSTHNHTDHLDAATLVPILKNNPNAVLHISAANTDVAASRLGSSDRIVPLREQHAYVGPSFCIRVVPAAHDEIERDEHGYLRCVGYIINTGLATLFHSGDTIVYEGMSDLLRPYEIDVAILPINGKVGNMDGIAAARLAKAIGAKVVIPCHFEMFEFNTVSPADFVRECERLGQPYRVLRAGERYTMRRQ